MTIEERIKVYTRRRSDGKLRFKLIARAHLQEILDYDPTLLTQQEINSFTIR